MRRLALAACVLAADGLRPGLPAAAAPRDVRAGALAESEAPAVARAADETSADLRIRRLVASCEAAAGDKRLLDEVVALFGYSGTLRLDAGTGGEERWAGQGAVKRGLARFLFTEAATALDWECRHSGGATVVARGPGGARVADCDVAATFDGEGGVDALTVSPRDAASRDWLRAVVDGGTGARGADGGGPRWETYDGRVRQKIWQVADCFREGSTFVKDTLELTTGRLICVVDQTVWNLYGPKLERWAASVDLKLEPIVAPGNEDEKTMDNMLFMLDELCRVDPLRRSEPMLAIGGGVLTDTAGFAAALWRRGVPWARMPTTLLGMVDASVGIKVAVNYHRKNGVGHFYSPTHTFVDASFLPTLGDADVKSGCGEIMKAALVHDATLFDLMEAEGARLVARKFVDDPVADDVIKRSVDTMLECIGPDLWEESLLRPMDFGHSFSRTLETTEAFKLRHGEAVAIDCVMSSAIANVKGLLSDADLRRVLDLYAKLGLPCSIDGITADTYKRAAREITVHRDGILRAPLPRGIGSCAYVDDISDAEVEAAFANLERFIADHPETKWDPSKSFASA